MNFLALLASKPRIFMCDAPKLSGIVRANIRLNIAIPMLFWSRKKKEPKPKLFGPDIFRWGGGFRREGVGAKKFGMSFETQGKPNFSRDIPGFRRDIPGVPEKFEKKSLCSILGPYNFQKNPRAHKKKIGTPLPPKPKIPPPPPKTRNFMDMGFSCRKNAFSRRP